MNELPGASTHALGSSRVVMASYRRPVVLDVRLGLVRFLVTANVYKAQAWTTLPIKKSGIRMSREKIKTTELTVSSRVKLS